MLLPQLIYIMLICSCCLLLKVVGDVKEVVKKSVSSVCAVISSLTIVLSDSDLSVASQSQDSSETSQSLSDYIATIAHLNPSSSTNTSDNGDVSDEGDEVMSHRGIVKNIWVHCALLVQNILCQHNNLILEFLPLLLKSIYGVDEVTSGGVPVGIFPSEAECLLVTTLSILTASFASASGNHEPARLLKPSTSSDMWVGLLSTLRVLLANNCHWLTLMVTICRNMDASAGDPSIATGNGVKYVYAVASALSHILTTQSIQSSKKVGIKLPSISSIWLSSGLLELLLFGETSLPLMDVELYKTLSSIVFFGSLCAYETDNTGKPLTYATLQSKTQSAVRAEYRDIVDVVHRWQHSSLQNNNSNETANGATLIWLTGLLSYRPCAAIAIADRAANVNVDASNAEQQWYKCLSLFLDQIVHYIESQALLLVLEEVAHQVGEDIKPSSPIGEGDKRSDLPTSPHDERVNYSSSSKDGGDGVASSSMVDTSVTVDAPNPSILPEVVTADSPFNADTAPTAQWADELIRGVGENRQKRVLYPWDVDFVFDHLLGEHQHMGFLGSKRGVEEVFDSLACVEWLTTASVSHQEDTSIDSSNSNSTVKNGSTNILVVLQRWLKAISVTLLKEQQWLNGYISQGDQHRQDRLSLLAPLQRHLHRWIRQCKACISKFQNQLQSSKVD